MQRKMSRLEASKSFLKSLVTFIEAEEVPTQRRSRRRKKSKERWSPDAVSASSSMPKAASRQLSGSPEFIKDLAPQELAMSSWTLAQSKSPTTLNPTSEAATTARAAATALPHQSLVSEATGTREGREQGPPSNQVETAGHGAPLEIQNFKFHDLGLPSA